MTTDQLRDDLGVAVPLTVPPQRVVSLVPSITESVAGTGLLVGATDWCTHPADLDVARVRGTKNPDRQAVLALKPDLVLANQEENRELDVRRLREAGVPVWVSVIEALDQAFAALERIFREALQLPVPEWLGTARVLWAQPASDPDQGPVVAVPIWRDPWMVVGSRTFTGDVLVHLGARNAFADSPERYPHVELASIDRPGIDLALLPDEPYRFTETDGPEAFTHVTTRLVSGRLLTWYGPSLIEARHVLPALLT
jgi:hypothetical protein